MIHTHEIPIYTTIKNISRHTYLGLREYLTCSALAEFKDLSVQYKCTSENINAYKR